MHQEQEDVHLNNARHVEERLRTLDTREAALVLRERDLQKRLQRLEQDADEGDWSATRQDAERAVQVQCIASNEALDSRYREFFVRQARQDMRFEDMFSVCMRIRRK